MKKLTRRKLITQASVGTGAAGVLAISAACTSPSKPTSVTASSSVTSVKTLDEPLGVFVTDPVKGTLKIMRGDREIIINNPSIADSLLALV
jgi:hypothetical protein